MSAGRCSTSHAATYIAANTEKLPKPLTTGTSMPCSSASSARVDGPHPAFEVDVEVGLREGLEVVHGRASQERGTRDRDRR